MPAAHRGSNHAFPPDGPGRDVGTSVGMCREGLRVPGTLGGEAFGDGLVSVRLVDRMRGGPGEALSGGTELVWGLFGPWWARLEGGEWWGRSDFLGMESRITSPQSGSRPVWRLCRASLRARRQTFVLSTYRLATGPMGAQVAMLRMAIRPVLFCTAMLDRVTAPRRKAELTTSGPHLAGQRA
ncbi:hypothetical protein GCM10009735_85710 [Actinomadura chokoriensis]